MQLNFLNTVAVIDGCRRNSNISTVPTILALLILGSSLRPIISQIKIENNIIMNGMEQWDSKYISNLEMASNPDCSKKQSREMIYEDVSLAWRLKSKKFWS